MYVREAAMQTVNQGGPRCVNIEEADSRTSPDEADISEIPGSMV